MLGYLESKCTDRSEKSKRKSYAGSAVCTDDADKSVTTASKERAKGRLMLGIFDRS